MVHKLQTSKMLKVNAGAYDQKGFSAKFGVEKERYAASVDYSENQGNSTYVDGIYDNDWNVIGLENISQDFKNEIINVKGRVNAKRITLHFMLAYLNLKMNLSKMILMMQSTIQQKEAELYSKWQFSSYSESLSGIATQKY